MSKAPLAASADFAPMYTTDGWGIVLFAEEHLACAESDYSARNIAAELNALTAEVRRLRDERAAILADFADIVGNCEVWGDNPDEMRNVTREGLRRLRSHNNAVSDGAKTGGSNV